MALEISILWELAGDAVDEDEEVFNESENAHCESS